MRSSLVDNTDGNSSQQLEQTITCCTQFLTLFRVAALLVGGVSLANAVKVHIDSIAIATSSRC